MLRRALSSSSCSTSSSQLRYMQNEKLILVD